MKSMHAVARVLSNCTRNSEKSNKQRISEDNRKSRVLSRASRSCIILTITDSGDPLGTRPLGIRLRKLLKILLRQLGFRAVTVAEGMSARSRTGTKTTKTTTRTHGSRAGPSADLV